MRNAVEVPRRSGQPPPDATADADESLRGTAYARLPQRDLSGGLSNAAGLARILGVTRARVLQLRIIDGFPEAIPLAGAPERGNDIWPVAEVLAWREQRSKNGTCPIPPARTSLK